MLVECIYVARRDKDAEHGVGPRIDGMMAALWLGCCSSAREGRNMSKH